ncbi:hypothetical protein TVAGG3_0156600, partial [Trichomonas vaginalis G3]
MSIFPFCTYICRVYHRHPAPICAELEKLALLFFNVNVANTFPILHIYMQGLSPAPCTYMCRMGKACTFSKECHIENLIQEKNLQMQGIVPLP